MCIVVCVYSDRLRYLKKWRSNGEEVNDVVKGLLLVLLCFAGFYGSAMMSFWSTGHTCLTLMLVSVRSIYVPVNDDNIALVLV